MDIIDRIILFIYTVFLIILSIGIILFSLRFISLDLIQTSLLYIYGQWEAAFVGLVFLLISVRLLLAGLRYRKAKGTIIHHNTIGDVHISLNAVENLVIKVARQTRGVRDVKVSVMYDNAGLKINIKAVISPDSNVPNVSSDIQQRVSEYIRKTVGIESATISVLVENISNDFKPKQRVQ